MTQPVMMQVTYRAKPGKEEELFALVKKHWPALQSTGLAVDGSMELYRATNKRTGAVSFVEFFSWRDENAAGLAHQTPEVMKVWEPMTPLLENLELNVIERVSGAE